MSNSKEQQLPNTSHVEAEGEKKYSKLQWLFACFIIPLLFAIVVALVVMTVTGFNVFDLAHKYSGKIPVVSSIMAGDKTKSKTTTENIHSLKATIEDQKVEIEDLKAEIESKQNDLQVSQEEIDDLNKKLQALQKKQEKATVRLDEVVKVYETMSAKKSAEIFANMKNEDVLEILIRMNNAARAAVLEKMDPVKAADLTVLLKAEEEKTSTEINNG
ncbi:MAG TPA: MgtE protein [Bacillus bacterium]|nr:MgtE protein [Bacillus sp. (in: firmicutes)]